MGKPILYGPTYSTYTRAMRMVLAEKGVEYDLVEVDTISGAFPAGSCALAKLPRLSHWWLAMQQRPSLATIAPKMRS